MEKKCFYKTFHLHREQLNKSYVSELVSYPCTNAKNGEERYGEVRKSKER